MTHMLSPHFALHEFTKSDTAERNGINNNPGPTEIENLQRLCLTILEPVRRHFESPVIIRSGFRSLELEAFLYRVKLKKMLKDKGQKAVDKYLARKQHPKGEAGDWEILGVSNYKAAYWVEQNLQFDQLILEFYYPKDPNSGWVHTSRSTRRMRKESLTINKDGVFKGLLT